MEKAFLKAAARASTKLLEGTPRLEPNLLQFVVYLKPDQSVQAVRTKLERLLAPGNFSFFAPLADDLATWVLQFQGVVREQSTEFLFRVAQWLAATLEVAAVDPVFEPGWPMVGIFNRAQAEGVGGAIVSALCNAQGPDPIDALWSVKQVNAHLAWQKFNVSGKGILIGQPDSGVAQHDELSDAIDMVSSANFIEAGPAIDPLSSDMSNPGHGTATSSVVASRKSGQISGVAPGAVVVPIRCLNSVVIGSGVAVAQAIDHASAKGCHIISMSLGGPIQGRELRGAIDRAVDAGMIVMAAAGNCVGLVVFPASYSKVIAVGGVNQREKKWKGSSVGAKVDVSAPAERVFVAHRKTPTDSSLARVETGQGTSFAVATLAGVAALWLERFGVATVREVAVQRRCTVQELFRTAVRQTARVPATGFDTAKQGSGIVDAQALLSLPLASIGPIGPPPKSAFAFGDALGPPDSPEAERFGTEASYLAFDRAQRAVPQLAGALEAMSVPQPSPGLSKILDARSSEETAPLRLPKGALLVPPTTPASGNTRRILAALSLPSHGVESADSTLERATAYLVSGGQDTLIGSLEKVLKDAELNVVQGNKLIEAARGALSAISKSKGVKPSFSSSQQVGLEALIRLGGRPALAVRNDEVDLEDPRLGNWVAHFAGGVAEFRPVFAATGRIDVKVDGVWIHVGTGTLVGDGVILTNRHVAEAFSEPMPARKLSQELALSREVGITFDEVPTQASVRHKINKILSVGKTSIGRYADVKKLDMALLGLARGANGLPRPVQLGALPLLGGASAASVFVVGYPAQPDASAGLDPATGKTSREIWAAINSAFGIRYGTKLVSPGEIMDGPGTLSGDDKGWAFSHDASTMPGNSGSGVMAWMQDAMGAPSVRLAGLHFGGAPLRQNLAHDLNQVRSAAVKDTSWIDLSALPL